MKDLLIGLGYVLGATLAESIPVLFIVWLWSKGLDKDRGL